MSDNTSPLKAIQASASLSKSEPSAIASCQQATHHIDAQYLYRDHADTPVISVPYRLTLISDPSVVIAGVSDSQGKVFQTGLLPGQYDLEFIPQENCAAKQKAEQLRKAFKQALKDIIIDVQQSTQFQEQVLEELNWAEEGLVYTGAFMQGAWDTVYSFGEFIGSVGSALYEAEKAYLDIWGDIATGNFDEVERKIQNSSKAASRFFAESHENFEKLVLLLSDSSVTDALADFPEQYWDALSSVEQTRLLASVGTDIALEIIIAVVSGGLAIPAQLAKLSKTSATLIKKAMQLLDELAAVLKQIKPRKKVQVPVNSPKTYYVNNSVESPLAGNHGGSSFDPALNDAGKPTPSIEKTPFSGEPISMVTGEEILVLNDFTLPGPIALKWQRTYRSGSRRNQGLGIGWSHSFNEFLTIRQQEVVFSDSEGKHIHLPKPEVGEFTVNEVEGIYLHREYHNRYVIKQHDKHAKLFIGHDNAPLIKIVDNVGNHWQCTYKNSNLTGLKSSWGTEINISVIDGLIESISLLGDSHQPRQLGKYQYDIDNNLIEASDSSLYPEFYQYKNHQLIRRTLKSGYSFYLKWDRYEPDGKCIKQWGDNDQYRYSFEWNEEQRISKSTDSNGGVLEIHYNALGRIIKEITPTGSVTQYQYDQNQRLTEKLDPNGHQHTYKYNEFGKLIAYLDPAGGGFAISYDENQNPIEYSDALGNSWITEYDQQGLVSKSITPEGFETQYFYNDLGLPVTIINPNGLKRFLEWNTKGQLIADSHGQTNENSAGFSHYHYNELGQITHTKQGHSEDRYQYDASGNLAAIRFSDGRLIKMSYNRAGQLTQFINSGGHTTSFEYDGLSQVTRKTNALGYSIHYHYDAERNLVGLTNEKGEHYHFSYDADERLIKEIGFDGREQHYQYDQAGFLTQHTEGECITEYIRDPLGRALQKRSHDGAITNFVFDAKGQLTQAINQHRVLQFEYSPQGQVIKETQDAYITEHQYDHFGNRIDTKLPNGQTLSYEHSELGELKALRLNNTYLSRFQHDEQGREIARQQGSLVSQWQYDPSGRLNKHTVTNQQSKQGIISREYRYDPAGNLGEINDHAKGRTRYQYDALNQLKAVEGFINETFHFDPAGNITQGQNESQGNRLAFHADRHFSYDKRGNLVEERRGKGGKLTTLYQYNADNQLIEVEKNGQRFHYTYDALGRRISKKDEFGETSFLWNGEVLLSEERNHQKKLYIYEPNSFKPLAHIENNQCYFYHLDHLGTPQEITNWEGGVVWSGKYKAYGNLAFKQVEDVENNLRFQGQYYDQETGLHYNLNRYYDPSSARFINQDPIGLLGGDNNYQYAPNPIAWIDPFGLKCKQNTWNKFQKHHKGQFKNSTEASKAYKELKEQQSPWPFGYDPESNVRTMQPGDTFNMIVDNGKENMPGRFGTTDNIPDTNYGRQNLAIKEEWKPTLDNVVTYQVKKPFDVYEGPVGPQIDGSTYLKGGGSQITFKDPEAWQNARPNRYNKNTSEPYLEVIDVKPLKN